MPAGAVSSANACNDSISGQSRGAAMWVTPFCSWLLCGLDKLLEPGPDTATGVVHCCDAQAELRGDTLARLSLDGCAPERLPRVIADLRANPGARPGE